MPILNTPITTNDQSLDKVLAQNLPALLVFHRDDIDKPLDDAIRKEAKKRAGDVLIVRLDTNDSRDAYVKYGEPPTPALVAITSPKGMRGKRKVISDAERIRPATVRQHLASLVDGTELPDDKPTKTVSDKPVVVSDSNFRQEVLKSDVPVLVDFWAAWCGPCRMVAPHVDELAKEYSGRVKVAKLDVDRNQMTAGSYNVRSIPTFIIFEAGQPAERIVGANPTAIRQAVARYAK